MCHAPRVLGLAQLLHSFASQCPMRNGGRKSTGRVDYPACCKITEHLVATVSIDKDDTIESLANEGVGDVVAKIDEHGFPDVYSAGKTHVVLIEAVMNHGRGQESAVGTPCGLFRDMFHENIVGINR